MEQTFMRYISPLRATGHRPEAQNRIPRRPQRPGGSEAEAERQGDVVTRDRSIVETAPGHGLPGIGIHAEEELVLRVAVHGVLVGQVEHRRTRKREAYTGRQVVAFGSHRAVEVEALVLEHRGGVPAADTEGQHGQRLEFEARTYGVGRTEVVLELEFVLFGLDDEPGLSVGHVLHPDAVVPVAFVVHGDDGKGAERIGSAEQQARRRDELPAVGSVVGEHRRAVGVDLAARVRGVGDRRLDVGRIGAVERIEGRRMVGYTQTQPRHGAHDGADLEVQAAAVEHRLLVERGIVELRGERRPVAVHGGTVVEILLLVGDPRLLVDALDAERGADVEYVVDVGAQGDLELVDRSRIGHIDRMDGRCVVADHVGHHLVTGLARHEAVVAQDRRPEVGHVVIAERPVLVREDPVVGQLLAEDVGQRGHGLSRCGVVDRLRGVGVARIEVGDPVESDAERHAHQRTRGALEDVERRADVGEREAGPVVALPRQGIRGLALRHREHRRQRDLAAAVHAQTGRVDRHGRHVGAERSEGPAERHGTSRPEIRGTRQRGEILGQHQVVAEHQPAKLHRRLLCGGRHGHQAGDGSQQTDYDSFHVPILL